MPAFVLFLAMASSLQTETLRPQFHFTAPKGWLNDPNGLVYAHGEYHLFYQHNPHGTEWGNMTWGHAVSKDLLHWKHLPHALEPDASGTMYSGSAVVDRKNSSGLGNGQTPPIVMFYTAAGGKNEASKGKPFTQGLAYSTDGRRFAKFAGNPIIGHIEAENRDPKVFWHAPSRGWIMALYLDGNRFTLFRSPDLKQWTRTDNVILPGDGECPDLFELSVGGKKHWVFWGASGRYVLGDFDGFKFTATSEALDSNWGPNCYAAQTYSDAPRGRRIQFAWMRDGKYPGMPFNQQMTLPRELTLRQTAEGPRLSIMPVKELTGIRKRRVFAKRNITGDQTIGTQSDLLEVRAQVKTDQDAAFTFGEIEMVYEASSRSLKCLGRTAKIVGDDSTLDLIVYLDRTSIEIFANHGLTTMPFCFVPKAPISQVKATSAGGFRQLEVYELKSTLSGT